MFISRACERAVRHDWPICSCIEMTHLFLLYLFRVYFSFYFVFHHSKLYGTSVTLGCHLHIARHTVLHHVDFWYSFVLQWIEILLFPNALSIVLWSYPVDLAGISNDQNKNSREILIRICFYCCLSCAVEWTFIWMTIQRSSKAVESMFWVYSFILLSTTHSNRCDGFCGSNTQLIGWVIDRHKHGC